MTRLAARHGLHQRLEQRFGKVGDAIYAFFGIVLTLSLSGFAAYLLHKPLLFASLGPTAILFFELPMGTRASPRNALIGHGLGLAAAWLALLVFGLIGVPSVLEAGVSLPRIAAAALSVASTAALQILFRAEHPPAGSTTLLISLGLLSHPEDVPLIVAGILILTVSSWLLNRALGIPVPLWAAKNIP